MSEAPPPLPPPLVGKKGLSTKAKVGIGVVVGIVLLIALAGSGSVGSKAILRAKKVSSLAEATSLETAINQFYGEYGALPGSPKPTHDRVFDTSGPEGQEFLAILMGKEPGPLLQNPKKLAFYIGRAGKAGRNGLIALPSGLSELRDTWGNPYYVVIDGDYDESLTPPADSGSTTLVKGHRVLVYSLGAEGKGGAEAVRTW